MSFDQLVAVEVLGVPIELWLRASAHQEAIQREFDIMRASQPRDSVPNRLQRLIEEYDARFGPTSAPTWEELRLAAESGETRKDLVFRVPADAAAAAAQLKAILAEVDAYCRKGKHLVTLATPDELVAFREWLLGEFVNQIENKAPPRPWDEYVLGTERTPTDRPTIGGSAMDTITFAGPLDLTTAGSLRDEIQRRRKQGLKQLTLDLSEASFVDSIGIGLLVTTHNRLASEGVDLKLIAAHRLQTLLQLSGLTELLRPESPPDRAPLQGS